MTVSVLRTRSAREYHTQQGHYLYEKVTWDTAQLQNFTTAGVAVPSVFLGVLPANSLKQEVVVRINTTFDGLLTVGTSSDIDKYFTTSDVVQTAAANTYVTNHAYGVKTTVDVPVYVSLSSGSTVGEAEVWLTYLPAK
jgi:hypothetical protein